MAGFNGAAKEAEPAVVEVGGLRVAASSVILVVLALLVVLAPKVVLPPLPVLPVLPVLPLLPMLVTLESAARDGAIKQLTLRERAATSKVIFIVASIVLRQSHLTTMSNQA